MTPQEYKGRRLLEWERNKWYRASECLPLPQMGAVELCLSSHVRNTPRHIQPKGIWLLCLMASGHVMQLKLEWAMRMDIAEAYNAWAIRKDLTGPDHSQALATAEGWTRPVWTWESRNERAVSSERFSNNDVVAWMSLGDVPIDWFPAEDEDGGDDE